MEEHKRMRIAQNELETRIEQLQDELNLSEMAMIFVIQCALTTVQSRHIGKNSYNEYFVEKAKKEIPKEQGVENGDTN